MIVPNFASRPYLNTRPVWLVTAAAVILTVVLGFANAQLYVESNQALAAQLAQRDLLQEQHSQVHGEATQQLELLNRVPWRSYVARVETLNVVLEEHGFSWLTMLDHLGSTMPYGVRVVAITPAVEEEGVILVLFAVGRTREDMLKFFDNLIADPHFDEPMPRDEKWPEATQAVGYVFDLEVKYDPTGGEA